MSVSHPERTQPKRSGYQGSDISKENVLSEAGGEWWEESKVVSSEDVSPLVKMVQWNVPMGGDSRESLKALHKKKRQHWGMQHPQSYANVGLTLHQSRKVLSISFYPLDLDDLSEARNTIMGGRIGGQELRGMED